MKSEIESGSGSEWGTPPETLKDPTPYQQLEALLPPLKEGWAWKVGAFESDWKLFGFTLYEISILKRGVRQETCRRNLGPKWMVDRAKRLALAADRLGADFPEALVSPTSLYGYSGVYDGKG